MHFIDILAKNIQNFDREISFSNYLSESKCNLIR